MAHEVHLRKETRLMRASGLLAWVSHTKIGPVYALNQKTLKILSRVCDTLP